MNYNELFVDKSKTLIINTELAIILGDLNCAIVLNQINYWIAKNKENGKNYYDGRYWVYNSYENWKLENFPFWSTDTVKRTFTKLENAKIVISGNYNKYAMDKTKWYTIDYDKLQEIVDKYASVQSASIEQCKVHQSNVADCTDGNSKMHQAIPENNTENNLRDYNTEITDNIYASVSEKQEVNKTANQSRYISDDYSYEQLREHIRPVYSSVLKNKYEYSDFDTPIESILDITINFYKMYEEETGTKHRVLSDKAYENAVDYFMNPPDILDDYMFDTDCYMAMAEQYFQTEYNRHGNYKGTIEKSFSHFMSCSVREHLFYQTCY